MNQLKQIQSQMFLLGLHQDRFTLSKLMAFCTDPSLGNLNYGEEVFHYIQNPCLFVYYRMIKAFAKRGSFRSALELFRRLREEGLWPDSFKYPFVFKAIGCLREPREGAEVHGLVVKTGFEFDAYVCNSLIDMYTDLGMVRNFKQLFDAMPYRNWLCWNVTISGYVRCRRFEDAFDMFQRMRCESNKKPDETTVVSTLSACTALKNLELGRRIFDEIPSKNVICCTSMVSGYVNCGRLDEAREVFDVSSIKDAVLWTAMINGYVQYNRFDEAVALFQEMQIRRVKGDKFTAVTLLTCCAQSGALD
ncbi:unnamed protein product [Prunus armeniaca]|uniref:Pentacotripeptide-repeat region of PRORP domain-containing protein n=1 Tax=Prunus armeniaca TaxID=36596 RepID=A0A6J5Y0L2_PRUAR|nr:unnamed protein product [Prunus armeniaca]CAB4318911.1 unnamed protein product [Prunus armeniaca]